MENIKGFIFDYGGTIDTNSRHWSEVLWEYYQKANIPVTKDQFREAYVHGERTLAKFPLIKPYYAFDKVLQVKVSVETEYLVEKGFWVVDDESRLELSKQVSTGCYEFAKNTVAKARKILDVLALNYPMVLVSNFYGNINAILEDFYLDDYFAHVIESAAVGVRKPDPKIYQLGVDAMGLKPEEIMVVGDSFSKDVVPAKKIGCKVAWLKGEGWGNEVIDESLPDHIITDLSQVIDFIR